MRIKLFVISLLVAFGSLTAQAQFGKDFNKKDKILLFRISFSPEVVLDSGCGPVMVMFMFLHC